MADYLLESLPMLFAVVVNGAAEVGLLTTRTVFKKLKEFYLF
jgi:hypothetical protein